MRELICITCPKGCHLKVDEENDYSICDVINDPNRRKTQDIVSFLREKKFAGGIRPTAYVQPVTLWKKTIDIMIEEGDI